MVKALRRISGQSCPLSTQGFKLSAAACDQRDVRGDCLLGKCLQLGSTNMSFASSLTTCCPGQWRAENGWKVVRKLDVLAGSGCGEEERERERMGERKNSRKQRLSTLATQEKQLGNLEKLSVPKSHILESWFRWFGVESRYDYVFRASLDDSTGSPDDKPLCWGHQSPKYLPWVAPRYKGRLFQLVWCGFHRHQLALLPESKVNSKNAFSPHGSR